MKEKMETFRSKIRPAEEKDFFHIAKTFLASLKESKTYRSVPMKIFYAYHSVIAMELLKHKKCLVMVNGSDDDQIFGWVICDPETLYYAYTKPIFREFGICYSLLEAAYKEWDPPKYLAHITAYSKYLKKIPAKYNPYKAIEVISGKIRDIECPGTRTTHRGKTEGVEVSELLHSDGGAGKRARLGDDITPEWISDYLKAGFEKRLLSGDFKH